MANILNPRRFKQSLEKNVKRSMTRIGVFGQSEIVDAIDRKTFAPNAPLTVALKGHSTPLVGEAPGALRQSIDFDVPKWNIVDIGVLRRRTQPGEDGKPDDVMDIAAAVHEGSTIKVTEKMRLFFAAIGHPLNPATTVIVVPGRPFLRVLLSRRSISFMKREWEKAVQAAVSGR
ncbi:hypothetical protein LCGC14_0772950 [marine sediment metagenome]|uniref:Uncharacterized protein n=1 Tax=marine sediment metagenome TaxID=412755 RepID=A0A0F9Q1X2_9ZZZZ